MLLQIFLCVLVVGVLTNGEYQSYERAMKSFYQELSSDYNPQILPKSINTTVVVRVNIFVRRLEKLDDNNMEYSLEITLRQLWNDQRLSFNNKYPFSYINSNDVSKFWVPDTYFSNEKKGHIHNIVTPNLYVRVFADGRILYSTRISLRLHCAMNLRRFPMDRQVCSTRLASYGYTTDDLVYLWKQGDPVQVVRGLDLPKFKIEGISSDYCSAKSIPPEYSCLKVDFFFKRHFMPYFLQIYLPCCILILISWLPFWLEKEAVLAQILLDVTLLLFMLAFIQNINSSLPAVSYLKVIDVWMYGCLCFIFISLMCVVLKNKNSRKSKKTWTTSNPTSDVEINNEMEHKKPSPLKKYHRWIRLKTLVLEDSNLVYRIMFPIAFILFACTHYRMAQADDLENVQPTLTYSY